MPAPAVSAVPADLSHLLALQPDPHVNATAHHAAAPAALHSATDIGASGQQWRRHSDAPAHVAGDVGSGQHQPGHVAGSAVIELRGVSLGGRQRECERRGHA